MKEIMAAGWGQPLPISAVTVGAMRDFGWTVDPAGADPFLILDALMRRVPTPASLRSANNLSVVDYIDILEPSAAGNRVVRSQRKPLEHGRLKIQ